MSQVQTWSLVESPKVWVQDKTEQNVEKIQNIQNKRKLVASLSKVVTKSFNKLWAGVCHEENDSVTWRSSDREHNFCRQLLIVNQSYLSYYAYEATRDNLVAC